ncbi:MAG: 30S ribosomal protein S20 [bacterium]
MPIKKAAIKYLRQTKKRTSLNQKTMIQIKFLVKHTRLAVASNKIDEAKSWLAKATKAFDKAAQRGLVKKNTSSRMISRLTKLVNASK